jgi:hypothetical protein
LASTLFSSIPLISERRNTLQQGLHIVKGKKDKN